MFSIVTAILPVFLLIFLGSWLEGRGFPGSGFWQPAERLTYRIFFPALIVTTLSGADLAGLSVLPMAGALVAAILLMAGGMMAVQRLWGVDGPAFTSMIQGAVRMNVYICLSIAAAVWGSAGLTVAAIAIAVIVPTVNLICVIALARWGSAAEPTVLGTIKQVATNPLIVAAVLGALSNFTGMPIVIGDVLDILGRAALPIGLLCVGAALDWPAVRRNARRGRADHRAQAGRHARAHGGHALGVRGRGADGGDRAVVHGLADRDLQLHPGPPAGRRRHADGGRDHAADGRLHGQPAGDLDPCRLAGENAGVTDTYGTAFAMTAPLAGLRVFDLTRILAGPTCTQLLGDLGAEVVKIERPGQGDDTRKWGPPYVRDADGNDTDTSAYYLSSNRNKRSLSLDIASEEGQRLARQLIRESDIVVENFKAGGLKKYGLSYDDVKEIAPHIIFCSITGFGQTGPYASRAGYDYLAQGMGGIMSLTGEPDGEPMKVGIGIADIMCGMYASSAILAALHHRHQTGEGQHIDLALLDTQVSWLTYEGLNYLTSGELPKRRGNEHPNIVPYKTMPATDGYFILAVGNDSQFAKFCAEAGRPELARGPALYHQRRARAPPRGALPDPGRDHRHPPAQGLGRRAERPRRTQRPGQHPRPGVRRPADPAPRHADPDGLSRSRQGQGRPDRQPDRLLPHPGQLPPAAAQMGEHTDAVLREALGLDADDIAGLRDRGVI